MAEFDFQSYVSCRRADGGHRPTRVQNYAYLDDIERQRQLSDIRILHKALGVGLQAWRFTEGRRLQREAVEPNHKGVAHLVRAWADVCFAFEHDTLPLRVVPSQKGFFEAYGSDDGVFFGLSGPACSLAVSQLKFLFGRGIGMLDNGHVPYLTLRRFADGLTRGLVGLAEQFPEALLHWYRSAQITQDRAGMLACRDISSAIFVLMKSSLDWGDGEIMREIRRYHEKLDVDWGTVEIERRVRALELFMTSRIYLRTSGCPIEQVDADVRRLYAIWGGSEDSVKRQMQKIGKGNG